MPTINIRRKPERFNLWPAYTVFLDGKKIDKIRSGHILSVDISEGSHSLKAKLGRAETPEYNFSTSTLVQPYIDITSNLHYRNLFMIATILSIADLYKLGLSKKDYSIIIISIQSAIVLFCAVFMIYYFWKGVKNDLRFSNN